MVFTQNRLKHRFILPIFHLGLILICLGLSACEDLIPEQVNALIAKADGGKITFAETSFRPDKPDVISIDAKGLKLLQNLVDPHKTEHFKCADDGSIEFTQNGANLITLNFNLGEECAHLSFVKDGEVHFYQIEKENLNRLRKNQCAPAAIGELSWILGKWAQAENDGSISLEQWTQTDNEKLTGHTFSLMNQDTTFSEKVYIELDYPRLVYKANMDPGAPPVEFKLSYLKDQRVMFENRTREFPQLILYQRRGTDTLHTRIEGLYGGHPFSKDYYLKIQQ